MAQPLFVSMGFTMLLMAVAALFAGTALVQMNLLDDVSSGISSAIDKVKQGACVLSHVDDFNRCNEQMGDYSDKREIQESDIKEYCCAYVRFKMCVEGVATEKCGQDAASAAESVLAKIQSNVLPSQCEAYAGPIDCLDRNVIIIAAVVVAVVGAGVLIALFCLIKHMCC